MRLQRVKNDLRGTDFAELLHLVGRYVEVRFTGEDEGAPAAFEFGHVHEIERPRDVCAYERDFTPGDFSQVDACFRLDAMPGSTADKPRAPQPPASPELASSAAPCAPAPAPEAAASRIEPDFFALGAPVPGAASDFSSQEMPPPRAAAPCASAPSAPARPRPGFLGAQRKASVAQAPADLGDLLANLDAGFSQTLLRLIDERGFSDAQVYKRANISRQLFSKIRKDESYRPTKQTAIALGVALELELDELEMLLERAGFALTHSSKADVIVEYFVTNGCYDVQVINRVLYEFDQPLLGSNAA